MFYEVLYDQNEVALAGLTEEDDTVTGQGGGCGYNSGLAGSEGRTEEDNNDVLATTTDMDALVNTKFLLEDLSVVYCPWL
jgi:hypothetical protein